MSRLIYENSYLVPPGRRAKHCAPNSVLLFIEKVTTNDQEVTTSEKTYEGLKKLEAEVDDIKTKMEEQTKLLVLIASNMSK